MQPFSSKNIGSFAVLCLCWFSLIAPVLAQESVADSKESSCLSSSFVSVPSRPTVANGTDVTQCGIVELEYGLERQWRGNGASRDDVSGGIRLGLMPNLDLHWSSSAFVHLMSNASDHTDVGDNWVGLKYRFLKQTKDRPSMGVFPAVKIPSASPTEGLGTGKVDYSLSFIASKDVRHEYLDFNVIELLAGRPAATGNDHNTGFALALWTPVTRRLTLVTEPYGYTSLNRATPAFACAMGGFSYRVQNHLYLDSGVDFGITSAAPKKRVYAGVTYAVGNLYRWLRPRE